jgi:dihydrofolate reductase
MFVTLDGFISGPNGELDWMPGTEGHLDPEVDDYLYNMLDEMDTMLLGARTYDLFVDYWPAKTTKDEIVADKLNAMTKVVFSSRPVAPWGRWDNARRAEGTVREEIDRLRTKPGKDMVIFGGATLAQSLTELRVIDEFRLFVTPIILGKGKPLFRVMDNRIGLTRVNARNFTSGTVLLSYAPEGKAVNTRPGELGALEHTAEGH